MGNPVTVHVNDVTREYDALLEDLTRTLVMERAANAALRRQLDALTADKKETDTDAQPPRP